MFLYIRIIILIKNIYLKFRCLLIDILSKHIIKHSIQIMWLQETWREKKYFIKIPSINNQSCMLFHYGPEKQEGHISDGVGFLLNPKGIKAWSMTGSHPPDYLPPINGIT